MQKLSCKLVVKIHKNTCEGDHIQWGCRPAACLLAKKWISERLISWSVSSGAVMHGLVSNNSLTASIQNTICLMKRWNLKINGILHENGIKVVVKQITDKIHSIRNYYSAERCKEAASKKSGPGWDDLYTFKWLFS